MKSIKAVLFDIDHTLLSEDPLIMLFLPRVYTELSKKTGMSKEEARKIFLEEIRKRRGTYEWHDWNFFFRLFGLDMRYEELLRKYSHKLAVYRDTVPTLEVLRERGYKLGVITSGPEYQRLKLELTGLRGYFDAVITRDDVGSIKPDPKMFLHAAVRLDIRPEEAVMVGDSLEQDVYGAKNVGMKAVWINREGIEGYHLADAEIRNLTSLLGYIEGVI